MRGIVTLKADARSVSEFFQGIESMGQRVSRRTILSIDRRAGTVTYDWSSYRIR